MYVCTGLILMSMVAGIAEGTAWTEAAEAFSLGPVPASVDLRSMLTKHLVQRSCAVLDATAERRRAALAGGDAKTWLAATREAVRAALGPMPFGEIGGPLNVRAVSRHERDGYVLENVLFESFPGLDVNGSVYLPLESAYPPPWPAIVVCVGHSAKTRESYQIPAQVFARLGYAAITFDPPGMAGEKREGNDHFRDGVRCYLTGYSSNRYFVLDALRCVDYLAGRDDIDVQHGVGMTGVSGGGVTTMYATLLDERIAAAGPSCCAVPKALHPVLDTYAECPEPMAIGRFGAYDDVDLLVAAMPTPVLLMAGAEDEVFTEPMSRAMAEEVAASFETAGSGDRFGFFLDPGGHAYSVAMAFEFVRWMDRWVRATPGRALPEISRDELEMLRGELLACHPRQDRNLFSVNRDAALALREQRSGLPITEAVRRVAGVPGPAAVPSARTGEPSLVWFHELQEVLIAPEAGIELPATYLYPAKDGWRGGAVLYFDERGRWSDLRSGGLLPRTCGFLNKEAEGRALLSVDLRGWGDSRAADVRYDLAGWGSRQQWCAYTSAALGDSVLAMRIRDGLSALSYLRSRPEVDPARVVLGGRGMGGVVALHVATLAGDVAGVFSVDGLAAFELLATETDYRWSPEAFLPNVLQHYDLPELVAQLAVPTLILNPRDANKDAMDRATAETGYAPALKRRDGFQLLRGEGEEAIKGFVEQVLSGTR